LLTLANAAAPREFGSGSSTNYEPLSAASGAEIRALKLRKTGYEAERPNCMRGFAR